MSLITNKKDLKLLRSAGKKLAKILQFAAFKSKEGVNLIDLDSMIEEEILKQGCRPSFKGFEGYPATTCLSLNHEVVHAIPKDYVLKNGDILGIDIGLWHDKVCVDAALTVAIGSIDKETKKLLKYTKLALTEGIKVIKPGISVGDLSNAIQKIANEQKLGIIYNLTGHGVGYKVHDGPSIPNYGRRGQGEQIKENMVLAIEPMFTLGRGETKTSSDGWGVETLDNSLAAQFEHTVLVTKNGCEIITVA